MRRNAWRGLRAQEQKCVYRTLRRASQAAAILVISAVHPALAGTPSPAPASPPDVSEILRASGEAGPTLAWIEFCEQNPRECMIDLSEPDTIPLTDTTWIALQEVNTHVNRTIAAVPDQDHWGVVDRWDYPDDGLGDCEDIQLLKRRLLVERGLPQRAMRMTVVIDELGAGHAVMRVRTDRGDLILDNKRDAVLSWQQTGYVYVKGEGADGKAWVWFGDQLAPTATAAR
nr:transglutaminase-like cysteine peptidase [Microvirga zambiensis]